jgi:sulfide:quinone oxidoreductase
VASAWLQRIIMPEHDEIQSRTGRRTHQTALILGGGFAGVETAIRLRRAGLAVTLVSDRKALFVYPTSIWTVTGEHRIEQDLIDLAELSGQHGFNLVIGKVEQVDAGRAQATVSGRVLSADVLVLAMGADRKWLPGSEHTVTVWGAPNDTVAVHDRLQALVARGSGSIAVGFGGNPADPSAMRGGPAFEVMFNIALHLERRHVRDKFELHFFAPMPTPGARMGEEAANMARRQLEATGVRLHVGKKLEGFDARGVKLEGGDRIDADLVIYIPAGTGHSVLVPSGLPLNPAGFVQIDEHCAVRGFDNVYAVGDVAALEGPDWRAKQGHLAEVMARVAASAIERRGQGKPARASYLDRMSIVCLMDSGNGAVFVERDARRARVVPLPIIGHWLKKAWGYYYRFTKFRLGHWLRWAAHALLVARRQGRARG